MELVVVIILSIVLCFYIIKFVQVLVKMNRKVLIPNHEADLKAIRVHVEKDVNAPTYASQKMGIIIYTCLLLLILVLFILAVSFKILVTPLYVFIFLPFMNFGNVINLFAVTDEGILVGNRFIAWEHIKSHKFVTIDVNHKFYGYSKEVDEKYELKIQTKGFPAYCIVTTNEMKEKLNNIMDKYAIYNNESKRAGLH